MIRLGRKTGGLLVVVLGLAMPVFLQAEAHAVSNILPELSAQGDATSLAIGRLADGNTLPTDEVSVKLIYADIPDQVRVFDGPYCEDSDYDKHTRSSNNPCSNGGDLDGEVYFDFQAFNNDTGLATGPVWRVLGTTMAANGGVNGNYTVNLGGLPGVARSTDNRYFVKVRVSWARPNDPSCQPRSPLSSSCRTGSNLFRFSIPRTTDYIAYSTTNDSREPLTVETFGPDVEDYSDVTFQFAPPCNATPAQLRQPLKWRDADYGESNQRGDIYWELIDDSAPGGPQIVASQRNEQLGGQGDEMEYPSGGFDFQLGHKYRWVWHHVYKNNGIELYFPFDNYNYLRTCPSPEPVVAQCGLFNIDPTSIDPNTPYRIDVGVNYTTVAAAQAVQAAGGRMYLRVNGPNVNYNNQNVPYSLSGGNMTASVTMAPTGAVGMYTVRWGVTGPVGAIDCGDGIPNNGNPDPPREFPVVNRPYFRANGDLQTGAGITVGPADCTASGVAPNNTAGIVSWNRNNNPAGNYGGAGTVLGALTRGRLQEFATAQTSTGGADRASQPRGLSFANDNNPAGTIDLPGGLYGGKFAGGDCVPDYFAGVEASRIQSGDITIAGQTVANGSRQAIYIRGNAYITGNITFSGNYLNGIADVPSFVVVVEGNIYVAPNVSRLDGFYIAQPAVSEVGNISRGNIYTCATAPFSAAALNRNLHNNCGASLTVNGSFSARQIWLLRAAGTVSSNVAAETFNYVPELWLAQAIGGSSATRAEGYDAITSLPPVL